MGMTREEFKILVKAMKAVYTHPAFIPDQHAFNIWYEMLKDIDYRTASFAVKKYMQSEEREPSVASIRKQAASLNIHDNELNEMAAWEMVQKAIRNSGYHAEEEFEKLPEIVQKSVVSPSQLKEWALTENLNVEVVSSNFKRTYRVERARENERIKLSPDVLNMISKKNKGLIEIDKSRAQEIGKREQKENIGSI